MVTGRQEPGCEKLCVLGPVSGTSLLHLVGPVTDIFYFLMS